MLRLFLLRHAKSSWAEPGVPDIERPLAPRGKRAATVIAKAMRERNWLPDRVLCSPSRRTRETLAALIPDLGGSATVVIAPSLYEPPSGDYRLAIAKEGGDARHLLVVGHNPAIQATAVDLAGHGPAELRAELAAKFPAGALAVVDFDAGTWAVATGTVGTLAAYLKPRDLDPDAGHDGD